MPRVTRNTQNAFSNENKLLNGKKQTSSIPVATKRKSAEEVQNGDKPKRKVFGEITNTAIKTSQDQVGKQGLKNQVKKGLNSFVERGKTSLRSSLRRKNAKKEEETASSSSSSSSSEEALVCVMETSGSSTEVEESEEVIQTVFVCPDPPRITPPEGVDDFDGETFGDVFQHSEYALETFDYYKKREEAFAVGDYIDEQKEITRAMRAILVDWLVEVQESFELNHETLYTAVKATDIYLSKKQAKKEDLQLIGATACFIACKIDERIPPLLDDFLYVCDDAYCRDQLIRMERKMLNVIGFDMGYSLSYRYIRRYGRVCKIKMPVLTLGRYILETALMEYNLNVNTSESKLAAAAMVLAMKMMEVKGYKATLEYYSGHTMEELSPLVNDLVKMIKRPTPDSCKTIKAKYSHRVFHEVANLPVPDVIDASSDQ